MSTPTTATATLPSLPRYNQLHYPFTPSHHQSYQDPNTATYRVKNPSLPSSSSARLAYSSSGYFASSSNGSPASNVISLSSTSSTRPVPQEPPIVPPQRVESDHTAMSTALAHTPPPPASQPARKRRRSKGPDWESFYKNGVPAEVIVIDDNTPEPAQKATSAASSHTLTNSHIDGAASLTSAHHVAKKRKRDDEPAHYDPVYHNHIVSSHANSPHHNATPTKSTISSDRTNSAIHTTAATSLDSLSSTGSHQYDYDSQVGQKRKRTTRQQIAAEAKRRDASALSDAFSSYRPPPYPPKKAADVHVKVIADVRVVICAIPHTLSKTY